MRVKETSDDYRYFPEPDLPPLRVEAAWLDEIRARLPELPAARRTRYVADFGLAATDASTLASNPDAGRLFEDTCDQFPQLDRRIIANWTLGEYLRLRNESGEEPFFLSPRQFGDLLKLVARQAISGTNAKEVLALHIASGEAIATLAARFPQISDAGALGAVVDEVLAANPAAVADYRAGKLQAVGFLVGQVMKATRGQANAALAGDAVRARLDGLAETTTEG